MKLKEYNNLGFEVYKVDDLLNLKYRQDVSEKELKNISQCSVCGEFFIKDGENEHCSTAFRSK